MCCFKATGWKQKTFVINYYILKHMIEHSGHFRTSYAWLGSGACCCLTFFTPPKVRSLERMEGRRPGEMPAGGRRFGNGTRGFPPGVGTRWPLMSPDPESAILNWQKKKERKKKKKNQGIKHLQQFVVSMILLASSFKGFHPVVVNGNFLLMISGVYV